MTYALGVDLGTTFTAAAVARDDRADVFSLGTTSPAIPSVVVVREDGEVLVGEPAERRAITEPARTAREFKRRLGDPAPLVLGGTPFGAEALMARLLAGVVRAVTEREGEPPSVTTVTHPANYGPYKRDLLLEMVRLADVSNVTFLTEPEAAAIAYAAQNRIEAGEIVGVYDFGGGTFDAALLRRTATAFEVLGTPEGMERLGGIDFDQAIFQHVDEATGGQLSELDTSDPQTRAALARLRADVRAAKETLSSDTDVTIPVMLPSIQTNVRLTRPEFEQMIRPRIAETITSFQRAVRSAGVDMSQVSRILLVGGSSRIPLVAEMIGGATARPVAVDAHPKFAVSLGAARFGAKQLIASSSSNASAPPKATSEPVESLAEVRATGERDGRRRGPPPVLLIGGVVALVALAAAAYFVLGGNRGSGADAGPTSLPSALIGGALGQQTPGLSIGLEPTGRSAVGSGAASSVQTQAPSLAGAQSPAGSQSASSFSGAPGAPAGLAELFAGSAERGDAGDGGPARDARFGIIEGMAVNPDGRVFLFDDTSALRVVDLKGEISRFGTFPQIMGTGPFGTPMQFAPDGSLLVVSPATNQLFRISTSGDATLVAGRTDAQSGFAGANGQASHAELWAPSGVAIASDGTTYLSDSFNNRIERLEVNGQISKLVGSEPGKGGFAGDGGPASKAAINGPGSLVIDASGRLYFLDTHNYRIRSIGPDGSITTVIGNGSSNVVGPVDAISALDQPISDSTETLGLDPVGRLYTYIAGHVVRLDPDGTLRLIAGGGDDINAGDVAPDRIRLDRVKAIEFDGRNGNLYIASDTRVFLIAAAAPVP